MNWYIERNQTHHNHVVGFNLDLQIRAVAPYPQDNRWQKISPGAVTPSARYGVTAVWSKAMDGFYVFGGSNDSCVLSRICESFTYFKLRATVLQREVWL